MSETVSPRNVLNMQESKSTLPGRHYLVGTEVLDVLSGTVNLLMVMSS